MSRNTSFGLLAALALLLLGGVSGRAQDGAPTGAARFRYRWVYVSQNLLVKDNLPKITALLKRAKAAGYNGILLNDYKFGLLDQMPPAYFANARQVKQTADELGLAIYPVGAPFGYSSNLLAHDPNLAEGVPVRDAAFVVRNGAADVEGASRNLLTNGGFEQPQGDRLVGWDYQDAPGTGSFVDRTVFHGGASSLRFDEIGAANAPSGNGRINRVIDVQPFHQYHLSVWIKTDHFPAAGSIQTTILPESGSGPSLCYNSWKIPPTQDWTEYHAVFNSLNNKRLRVYLGVWGGRSGKLWLDDAHVTEVGLLNVLRRDGCPFTVKDAATGQEFTEGRDFEPVRDPKMGNVPWPGEFEIWHQPPPIHLTGNSRIKEGERLLVSFSHTLLVYDNQATACLLHPKALEIAADQMRRTLALFSPPGILLSHDEIRVGNWDATDAATHLTPGQQLARNVSRCAAVVREAAPKAEVFVWSDMFDPSHNAHGDYYLVNGSWEGSWEGLPKDAVVLNWNSGKPKESLPFFANRGHRQILAGYYDGHPDSIRRWLAAAKGVPGIDGVMYTTWANRYDDLEAFAKAAWGE